ncbi:AAA-like domain-containing protein [Marinitoga litoralis]|uniref:AAA-like domain-containing protein n=1 Tax=Marinitoga litoralis TaxID=570855 RepID=UPI001960C75B|nr:AAA-like domain-containing protein [Marinitoga litoralis]MBM7560245.1 putative AAA+ superfamily ATPase [Marinitoga litoralis]
MKRFCTSGPVDKKTCYYVERPELMEEALDHIENWRYFTVSAPRQTGKTTFLNEIVEKTKDKYLPIFISFESYMNKDEKDFLDTLVKDINRSYKKIYNEEKLIEEIPGNIDDIRNKLEKLYKTKNKEIILMIDEFEKFNNEELMNQFLHVIRTMYHSKEIYGLRSVILISVGYLSGVLEDNASPFNIAEHMEVPYFTKEQVYDLLNQHEKETGQIFEEKVKELIWHNAGGQPGLTNALAYDLVVKKAKNEKIIAEKHFEKTLYDFLKKYINKNIENVISKAKSEKELIMQILFEPDKIEFDISDERIKYLYLNGVIDECNGYCCVKVPLYYKKLYNHFKPQINGEKNYMATIKDTIRPYIKEDGSIDINKLMKRYIEYIKQRGAKMFKGRNYYEGVYQYNLDQFLSLYVEAVDGKVYPETEVGGGRIDLLINLNNIEYLIEVKANITGNEYEKAKKQLIEYLKRKGLKEGWLIIYSDTIEDFEYITEEKEGIKIHVWLIKTNFESPSKAV